MKRLFSSLLCFAFLFFIKSPTLRLESYQASLTDGAEYSCFHLSVKNCEDLESFELLIRYNPDVLKYTDHYPFSLIAVARNSITCSVSKPGELCVIGRNDGYGDFQPFCFQVIGAGDTDISVELVFFKNADGEVENVTFKTDIENFTVHMNFVRYDLTGDGIVTPEDARCALRFAVGLDRPTAAQCSAVGVSTTDDFTVGIARLILRNAVGMEA